MRILSHRLFLSALSLSTVTGLFTINAMAEEAAARKGSVLEEIVITAARGREEPAQLTPMAITAMNEELLERNKVASFQDIGKLTPNLHTAKMVSTADAIVVYLRGFGTRSNDPSQEPRTSTFIDGVYFPTMSGTMLDMYDLETVEVLAGPQSTLLGKNAAFGAVNMKTARPTGNLGGGFQVDYGEYDRTAVRGKLDFPIIKDVLAGHISAVQKKGGDWIKDVDTGDEDFGGEDTWAGRAALRFTPNEQFTWDLVASRSEHNAPQYTPRFVVGEGDFQTIAPGPNNAGDSLALPDKATYCAVAFSAGVCPTYKYGTTQPALKDDRKGHTALIMSEMNYEFDPAALSFKYGYVDYALHEYTDVDGTHFGGIDAINDVTTAEQDSYEVRLSSVANGGWDFDGRLDWVLGFYYSDLDFYFDNRLVAFLPEAFVNYSDNTMPITTPNAYQDQYGNNKSTAEYFHLVFHIDDEWDATFGYRHQKDEKTHRYGYAVESAPFQDPDGSWQDNLVEFGLSWQFDPDKLVYFRYAEGYQTGGYAAGFPSPGQGGLYDLTENKAWEVGIKSDWLDKTLRVNFAWFYNDLTDLAVNSVIAIPVAPGFQQVVNNAGAASIQGFELATIYQPTDNLLLTLNVGYLDPNYSQYDSTICSPIGVVADCSNFPFAYAPEWNAFFSGEYSFDSVAGFIPRLGVSVAWKDDTYMSEPPQPYGLQDAYALVDAYLKLEHESGDYDLEFYVTNLTDEEYILDYSNSGGLTAEVLDGRPQEWGVRFNYRFGE